MTITNHNSKLGNPKSKYYLLPFRRSSRRGEARWPRRDRQRPNISRYFKCASFTQERSNCCNDIVPCSL